MRNEPEHLTKERQNPGNSSPRLLGTSNHVMCWEVEDYDAMHKLVRQLWGNLKRGYDNPDECSPYNDYWSDDEGYRQYWFLAKPGGEFDWTPGDLNRKNVS